VVAETGDMREFSATTPDALVSELAARQWGVVSRAQLRAQGLSDDAVRRRVRAGRLHRLHHGVYAVGHTVLRSEARRLAAVLACGEGAVLSHRSAAAHWGLLPTGATRIDVTIPRTARAGDAKIRLHHSRSLGARDTTMHEGIPITSVARTLVDLAATVRPDRLERALAQAERLQLYDHRAITDVLARANGHRGKAALTRATAREPKLTRSGFEARVLNLIRAASLPEPLTNFLLTAPDHPRLEVDLCWPTHRLIVELDGYETHRTRAAFARDRARDAALEADGWRVVRFTWSAADGVIVQRLTALLAPHEPALRVDHLPGDPAGLV
jgi:predicted transcriptional regulator of viral defense system/very-short-patch-repair endonuclease